MNFSGNVEIPVSILESGRERFFRENSNIFRIDSDLTHCYLILSGMIKIYMDHENGRRSIIDFVGKNDWIGELSLFCDEIEVKENKVIREVRCLEFDMISLHDMCMKNADVSFYFSSYISGKLLDRTQRMSEYLNYSLEIRLASFIMRYSNKCIYSIPHTDASEYLNVSYRHILYVIRQFCDSGMIEKGKRKEYRITDLKRLEKIAYS